MPPRPPSLPPRPTVTLDVSHRVHNEDYLSTLDECHRVQNEFHVEYDDDDWERPDLGNRAYTPVNEPKSLYEIQTHSARYPYRIAIHPTHPLDSLIFKRISRNQIAVLFPLDCTGYSYDFKPPPLPSTTDLPEFLTMRQCRETQWYYRYQPYLGFIPREDVFEGPIFGRFHGNRSYFETKVKNMGVQYIFDPALAQSWITVEEALLALMGLFHVTLRPLTAPRDSYPSDTRFFDPKPTLKKVVDSVLFAQKLILQLIGEVRYSMAISTHLRGRDWMGPLAQFPFAKDFDYEWLADLAASKAMTTRHLAGTLIHPGRIENGYHAHRFAHHDVPVYIPLALITCQMRLPILPNHPVTHTGHVNYVPFLTQEQLKKVLLPFDLTTIEQRIKLEWDTHYRFIFLNIPYVPPPRTASPEHVPIPSPVCPPQSPSPEPPEADADCPQSPLSGQEIPQPYPDSGQQPGQWWYEHHNHVKLICELGDDEELPAEQRRRKQKEKESEIFRLEPNLPSNFKNTVYIWELTDLHPTFLLRRRLSLEEVRGIWSSIPVSNKIYNSYDEEWDFYDAGCDMETRTHRACGDRDPTEEDVMLTKDKDIKGDAKRIQGDLKAVLRGKFDDAISCRMAFFCEDEPLGTAIRRFGFVFANPFPHRHTITRKNKVQWYFHLGYKDVLLAQDDIDRVEQILFCLQQNHGDHLLHYLDIYTNPRAIIDSNTVIIRHFPNAEFAFSSNHHRNLYILYLPGDNRRDWFVGLSQASDLVFALREGWATSREDLVDSFLVYGVQFYTLAPVPRPSELIFYPKAPRVPCSSSDQRQLFPDAPFTIPLEPGNLKYTATDFFEYERRREELLDKPYGRVAGRSGGIVARLWRRDTSKYQQRKREVLVGPTDLALWKGIRVLCGDLEFYDDELRGTTDGYICGLYQARKVDRPGVDDWHQMSWYSTNAAYNFRNKNIMSRWTQVDEDKFIMREHLLVDNLCPNSAKHWKKQARAYQGVLEGWIEEHCRNFIRQDPFLSIIPLPALPITRQTELVEIDKAFQVSTTMVKRPRAETSAASSHPSARARIDEPKVEFDLFDNDDLAELETSLFDGQLSDITVSDVESESVLLSEVEDEDPDCTASSIASGDWSGTRDALHNYRLPNHDDPKCPDLKRSSLVPTRLDNDQKHFTKRFCAYLMLHWPSEQLNKDLADDRHLALVDPTAFWQVLLQEQLRLYLGYLQKLKADNRGNQVTIGTRLIELLEQEIAANKPFLSGLLLSVYNSCLGHFKTNTKSDEIRRTLKESSDFGKKIMAAKRAGLKFAKEAIWIPVRRRIAQPVHDQHMVETAGLYRAGVNSGAIDDDAVMVGLPQGWRVIAAPPATSTSSYSLIFWEPKDANDVEPTIDKVIGACIHGADKRNPALADPNSKHIRFQCAASAHNLKTKTPLDRSVNQGGLMTKDIGKHATYAAPYSLFPSVEPSTSAKPTTRTIKRIQEQNQLRVDIKKYSPAIQSINFALLQGFLPNFANQQYDKAVEKKLINSLGRPDTSSFATYAYCAGLHLDKDESVTHGWVIKRGTNVLRRESNFVWGNHKVILQLNEGSHWFWRAHVDSHGTTANQVAMKHPGTWKTPAFLDREDNAQWTRASTIPKAVADATLRTQQ